MAGPELVSALRSALKRDSGLLLAYVLGAALAPSDVRHWRTRAAAVRPFF